MFLVKLVKLPAAYDREFFYKRRTKLKTDLSNESNHLFLGILDLEISGYKLFEEKNTRK